MTETQVEKLYDAGRYPRLFERNVIDWLVHDHDWSGNKHTLVTGADADNALILVSDGRITVAVNGVELLNAPIEDWGFEAYLDISERAVGVMEAGDEG